VVDQVIQLRRRLLHAATTHRFVDHECHPSREFQVATMSIVLKNGDHRRRALQWLSGAG
jgi:hypothetical protein